MNRPQLIVSFAVVAAILAWVCLVQWKPVVDFLTTSTPEPSHVAPLLERPPASTSWQDGMDEMFIEDWALAAESMADEETLDGGVSAVPARSNEKTFLFRDALARDRFLAAVARSDHLAVTGRIDGINAVSLGFSSEEALQNFLNSQPEPLDAAPNFLIDHPLGPDANVSAIDPANYTDFANTTLDWMGVPADNSGWGEGIKVAVVDAGVQAHPTFAPGAVTDVAVLSSPDAAADTTPAPTGDSGESGHGTAVASLIAGESDLARGVAPGAEILSLDVFQGEASSDAFAVASAIVNGVDQGAQVINLSVGGPGDSPVLKAAVDYALEQGVVLVAAAGNEGVQQLAYPAAYDGVVAVGAVDANGLAVGFSNTGPELDLMAPGYGVYTAWGTDQLVSMSGTSAATPLVAGAVTALLWMEPSMSGQEAVDLLKTYSNDGGLAGTDEQYGSGTVDFSRVLRRNQAGLNDAAVSGYYLDLANAGTASVPVHVTVQNQGTTSFNAARVNVRVNGQESLFFTPLLQPGQSTGFEVLVPATALANGAAVTVDSAISLKLDDAFPTNNQRSVLVRRPQ